MSDPAGSSNIPPAPAAPAHPGSHLPSWSKSIIIGLIAIALVFFGLKLTLGKPAEVGKLTPSEEHSQTWGLAMAAELSLLGIFVVAVFVAEVAHFYKHQEVDMNKVLLYCFLGGCLLALSVFGLVVLRMYRPVDTPLNDPKQPNIHAQVRVAMEEKDSVSQYDRPCKRGIFMPPQSCMPLSARNELWRLSHLI